MKRLKILPTSLNVNPLRIMLFAAFTAAIACAISIGPFLQTVTIRLINSDSVSIYEAVDGLGAMPFLSLKTWLGFAMQAPVVCMSAFVAVTIIDARLPSQMFLRGAFSAFLALECNDLVGFWPFVGKIDDLLVSTVANALGGVILAAIIVTWAHICQAGIDALNLGRRSAASSAAVGITVLGLLLSTTSYYVADYFLRLLPLRLSVLADAPLHGGFGVLREPVGEKVSPFTLLPPEIEDSDVDWTSTDGGLSAEWHSSSDAVKFDASVEFLSGCMSPEWLQHAELSGDAHVFHDVKAIRATFEGGASNVWMVHQADTFAKIGLEVKNSAPFGLEPGSTPNKIRPWEFVGEPSKLTYSTRGGNLSFYVGKWILDNQKDFLELATKKLEITVDGKTHTIEMQPDQMGANDISKCHNVPIGTTFDTGSVHITSPGPAVGIKTTITMRDADKVPTRELSDLTVSGSEGWVTVEDIERTSMGHLDDSIIGYLDARGNVKVKIDEVDDNAGPKDIYEASGRFRTRGGEDGTVNFYGIADTLKKNGVRANKTKFELATMTQIVSSSIGILLALLSTIVIKPINQRLMTNNPFSFIG